MYKKAKYFISGNDIIETENFDIKELEIGFSVYEVVKIIGGIPLFFEDHLRRLYQSAKLINTEIPFKEEEIKEAVNKLIQINTINEGRLKFAVRFHKSENKLICFFLKPIMTTEDYYKNGVKIISIQAKRENPNAKVINYGLRTYINKMIEENNIFEVLLYNKKHIISECGKSNIFFVKDAVIYTSFSENVLSGITGSYISEICENENIKITNCNIKLSDITEYEAAFITGTSIAVLPIKQIDSCSFSANNRIIHLLSDNYNRIVTNYIESKELQ